MASADTARRDIGFIGVAALGPTMLAPTTAAAITAYSGFAAMFIAGAGLALISERPYSG